MLFLSRYIRRRGVLLREIPAAPLRFGLLWLELSFKNLLGAQWPKWSGGTQEHPGCKWLHRGTPSAGNGFRAPWFLPISTLPRDCPMKPPPPSPSSPSGRVARGADRVRVPSVWSGLYGLLSQRPLARIAEYHPAASDQRSSKLPRHGS